jgi:hypothetical protein
MPLPGPSHDSPPHSPGLLDPSTGPRPPVIRSGRGTGPRVTSPETGINIGAVPGPRGAVTVRDLRLRQFVVTPA